METLGEIVGVLAQLDERSDGSGLVRAAGGRAEWLATDGGTFAHRRKVKHLDHLLARAERDGTLQTIFSPGYPPVRIDVAVDGDRAVVLVDDPTATVRIDGRVAHVETEGRTREVSLPFTPSRLERKTISGLTAVVLA